MEKELISVIVPIYNVEKYLERCIESITNQTYKNLEIILVDDGSNDFSGKICDKYSKKDRRIKVIHKKNEGLSEARNSGLEIARGEYIGFVDSDDYIETNMYEYLLSLLKINNADISVCGFQKVWDDIKSRKEENTIIENNNIVLKSKDAIEYIVDDHILKSYAWNKLYKRSLFIDIKYPKGLKMEDVATTYKLIYKSKIVVIGKESKYYYTQRKGSILNSKKSQYYIDYFNVFYERFLFLRNKNFEFDNLYISMINFILSLYLIKDKEVAEFRKKKEIKKKLQYIIEECNKKGININLKLIVRCKILLINEKIYSNIFRRYIKWKTKLNPQELL